LETAALGHIHQQLLH